jgi:hypothetical protein
MLYFFTTVELTLSGALIPDFRVMLTVLCVVFQISNHFSKIIILKEILGIIYRID